MDLFTAAYLGQVSNTSSAAENAASGAKNAAQRAEQRVKMLEANLTKTLCAAILLTTLPAATALAQYDPNHFDPTNAAHWYRKAFAQMEQVNIMRFPDVIAYEKGLRDADEEILIFSNNMNMYSDIRKYIRSQSPLTESIKNHIDKHIDAIDLLQKAASAPKCDWGYKLEDITQEEMWEFSKLTTTMPDAILLLLCNSLAHAENKDYDSAAKKWMLSFNTSHHYQLLLSGSDDKNLTGYSDVLDCANTLSPLMTNQEHQLSMIRAGLKKHLSQRPSQLEIFDQTTETYTHIIKQEKFSTGTHQYKGRDFVLKGKFTIDAYENHRDKLRHIWSLEYKEAYPKIEQMTRDFRSNVSAENNKTQIDINLFIISVYDRNILSNFWGNIFYEAKCNATYIASEIYLYHAKTGDLPAKIPAGMPKDPFSNKNFILTETPDGFTLRCQEKDIRTDKYHEYEFTLPKLKG